MQTLQTLRKKLDSIDTDILTLVAKRRQEVQKVGKLKKENNLPIIDKTRVQEALTLRKSIGKSLGLSDSLVERIYSLLHDDAVNIENEEKK